MTENEIGTIVVDNAVNLHKDLGPGLYENVYEVILASMLSEAGLVAERQVPIPIRYKDISFDEGFRADIMVNDKVILELKPVEQVAKAHKNKR